MPRRYVGLLLLCLLAHLTTNSVKAQDSAGRETEAEIATAPVVIDGEVLFRVRGLSSYPAEARARQIKERLQAVAADPAIPVDSLRTVEEDGRAWVLAGDRALMMIVEADAHLEDVRLENLAAVHLSRIRQAISAYREARSPGALRRDAVNILLATLLFGIAIAAVVRAGRHIDWLIRRLEPRIRTIGVQSFTLIRADSIVHLLRRGLGALRTIALLAIALLYLDFALAQFPWTRGLSESMGAFLLEPLRVIGRGVIASIPGVVFLSVLFYLARLALRVARLFFDAVTRGSVRFAGFDPEWAEPTYNIVRVAVIVFALVVAYPYIPGSDSDAFKGISIFLGIVFSLGSSSAISNIIAGYMMTYRRAFKLGDRVKIGNSFGDVIERRLQVTHLRSFKNEELIIPNSQILTSEVINYSSIARANGLILHTEVGIGYETPWRQVEAMLLIAAERTPGLLADARPFVRVKKLGDFAVVYELNVYCEQVQAMGHLYSEMHRRILDVFNEYGVQIMTPAYENDPPRPKIVSRRDWYAPPAAARAQPDLRVLP